MHASTLLPSLLLLSFSSISLAKPLPPRSTDGSQQDGSPVGVSAPEFTHPHAKELSDLAATLNDIAARIAVPPPDVLGSTEYQSSGEDDDDDYTNAAQDLGVGNLNGIEGLNGASLLPDNTFVPRRPSPTDKTENELQKTDRPHIKARHGADDEGATQLLDGAELDELNSLPPDRTIAPRDPSPTDMHPGTEQTDRPHRMLAALKVRHGGEHHGAPSPGDALPASEESDEDDEDDDETEGYYDDDDNDEYDDADTDPLTALSSAFGDAAAPSKRQSDHEGHHHGASPLDASNPLPGLSAFPPTGGQGGETIPDPAAIASLGGSGGQRAKKARAAPGGLESLTDGLSGGAGLGNVGGLPGAEEVEGLGRVVPGLGGRAVRWAA